MLVAGGALGVELGNRGAGVALATGEEVKLSGILVNANPPGSLWHALRAKIMASPV